MISWGRENQDTGSKEIWWTPGGTFARSTSDDFQTWPGRLCYLDRPSEARKDNHYKEINTRSNIADLV